MARLHRSSVPHRAAPAMHPAHPDAVHAELREWGCAIPFQSSALKADLPRWLTGTTAEDFILASADEHQLSCWPEQPDRKAQLGSVSKHPDAAKAFRHV